jgi:hypothetical protein
MYMELQIIRQEVEQLEDEDGVPYEKPIDDAWTQKTYSFDLRQVRIYAFESCEIMQNKCTIVYLNNDEVVIYPKNFEHFKKNVLPKYDHLLKQLSVLPFSN